MSSMHPSCDARGGSVDRAAPRRDLPARVATTGRLLQAAALPGVAAALPAGLKRPECGLLVFALALGSFTGGAVLVILAVIARDLADLRAKLNSL